VLHNAFQQLFVLARDDGFFSNLGIGPRDLGNEEIAEFHYFLVSVG
jgi:hypothetical protein